jgi:oligoendopeptidase F
MMAIRPGPIARFSGLIGATCLALFSASAPAAAPASGTASFEWDLTDLYPSTAAWSEALEHTHDAAQHLEMYRGTLGQNAAALLSALDALSAVRKDSARISMFAQLQSDSNLLDAAAHDRLQQAQVLGTLVDEQSAWVAPEIVALGAERVQAMESELPELARRFDHFLDNTQRAAPHTLSPELETILAQVGTILQQPGTTHGLLGDGELPFPTVLLSTGTKVRLDEPNYEKYRTSAVRADRQRVFDAFWGLHKSFEGTLGNLQAEQVMGDVFSARTRHFDNSIQAALFADNLPESVYRTLVSETHAALPTLHRYLRLRKRLLGISGALEYFDGYAPLFASSAEPRFSIQSAQRLTLAALEPLGDAYLEQLRQGFAGHWMSAYPRQGKTSGGYTAGDAYDVHPYLLLNHTGEYESLSAFAHEWGHAMHTVMADRTQPFEKSDYSLFIAETAAITNELLLNDYMVAHAKDKNEKLYYLAQALESIRTTYFRQVQFAEFELAMHEAFEQGHALSGDSLSQMYCTILKRYYGEAEGIMRIRPDYCLEWSYVSHFYEDFYVFKYATSIAGAAYFAEAIHSEGAVARDRFLTLLRAGGSDYPYPLYVQAGADLATPGPYRALMARMNRLIDEIEQLQRTQ